MTVICSWCPDAAFKTAEAIADGKPFTHGICPSCSARMDDELNRRPMMPPVALLPTQKQFAALLCGCTIIGIFWIGLLVYLMRLK